MKSLYKTYILVSPDAEWQKSHYSPNCSWSNMGKLYLSVLHGLKQNGAVTRRFGAFA